MLEWTGERYLPYIDPSICGAEIHYEHLHRYAFASQYTKGKKVLDLASGEGYGTFLLSLSAQCVIGVEIDHEVATHASNTYKNGNIEFREGSILNIPIDGEKIFDVIVCFEAIEHITEHDTLFFEIKRLLKDDGLLIISTPNKQTYTDDRNFHNPFHQKELYHSEFYNLLRKNFLNVYLFGQKVFSGSSIYPASGKTTHLSSEFVITLEGHQFSFVNDVEKMPIYFVALASNNKLDTDEIRKSYLIDKSNTEIALFNSKIHECNASIQSLEQSVSYRDAQLHEANTQVQSLTQAVTTKDQQLQEINTQVQSLTQAVTTKDQQLQEINTQVQSLTQAVTTKDQQLQEQIAHIHSLEQKIFSIDKSIVWQFTMKFHNKVVERILPQYTRRRRYYDLGRAGGKILINDGYHAFYQSVDRYFHKKNELGDCQKRIEQNKSVPCDLDQLKKSSQNFSYCPTISIITPVWNTDEKLLRFAIDSVINQVYDNWELCIVDGGSTKSYIKPVLEEYAKKNPRIKIKFLTENKGISENSNETLSLATGEFIVFLDHDDELAPLALYEVVKLLNQHIDAEIIYSDEDKITKDGDFCEPFYKPDWSPEYFRGVMYVGHLLIIRKSLTEKVGVFDKTFDYIQDYEFMLRLSEKTQKIYHIPKILYHWRKTQGSIALNTDSKGDISDKQVIAVNSHLKRVNLPASAQRGLTPHRVVIKPFLRSDYPLVSIIIPTRDKPELIERCLKSIYELTTYPHFEVLLIDNNTTDQAAKKIIDAYPCKKSSYFEEFNFSKINNLGAKNANGDYLIFLNNDTQILSGDWIHNLLYYAEQEDIAAVGPLLKFPNNTVQHAGVVLGFRGTADHIMRGFTVDCDGYAGSLTCAREVSAVTAACMMVKKSVFWDVGGFNEHYSLIYQDIDLCLKFISRGYRIIFNPRVVITHYESSTRNKNQYDFIDRNLFLDQWSEIIEKGDKYYNENFDLIKYGQRSSGYTVKGKGTL
jgi:GT2 family glycosyltransferase/SAM-dependent methyltransferase